MNKYDQNPFDDDIFVAMGLTNLSVEKRAEMQAKMQKIVEERIDITLFSMLSEEDRDEINNVEEGKLKDFLADRGIDLGALVVSVTQKFREELIGDMSYMQGQIDAQDSE